MWDMKRAVEVWGKGHRRIPIIDLEVKVNHLFIAANALVIVTV